MAGDRAGEHWLRDQAPSAHDALKFPSGNDHGKEQASYARPEICNEVAERAFWEKNDSTAYLDWKKAQPAVIPNLKPSSAKAGRYTSQDVHNALFPRKAPKGRPADAKEAIRKYIRKRFP